MLGNITQGSHWRRVKLMGSIVRGEERSQRYKSNNSSSMSNSPRVFNNSNSKLNASIDSLVSDKQQKPVPTVTSLFEIERDNSVEKREQVELKD